MSRYQHRPRFTKNRNLKITANWQLKRGEPFPVWQKLWTHLFTNKKQTPVGDVADTGEPTGGAKGDNSNGQ